MAEVRLPDGRELQVEPGDRARDVVERIGPRLARDAVVAKLNGRGRRPRCAGRGRRGFRGRYERLAGGSVRTAALDGPRYGAGHTGTLSGEQAHHRASDRERLLLRHRDGGHDLRRRPAAHRGEDAGDLRAGPSRKLRAGLQGARLRSSTRIIRTSWS